MTEATDMPAFLILAPTPEGLASLLDDRRLDLAHHGDAESLIATLRQRRDERQAVVLIAPEVETAERLTQQLLRAFHDLHVVLLSADGDARTLGERFRHMPVRAARVELISVAPAETLADRVLARGEAVRRRRRHSKLIERSSVHLGKLQPQVLDLSTEAARRQLFEALPVGLLLIDADGYVAEANRLAWTLLQRPDSPGDLARERLVDLVPQWQGLAEGLPGEDLVSFTRGGRRHHLRLRAVALAGMPATARLVTVEDVTEQEEARHLLATTALGLEFKAAHRARALSQVQRERDSIKYFIATLVHDLRNPVAAALVNVDVLRRWARQQPPRVLQTLQRIQHGLHRLDRMIADLLDLTRYDTSGALPIHPELIRLDALAREVVDEQRGMHAAVVELREPLPEIAGSWDGDGIRRALENLLSNAVKYGSRDRPITVWLRQAYGQAELHVRNFGAPIPEEVQRVMFEPFYRASNPATDKVPGWGVGLAFVRAMIESHGGSVSVASSVEQGTVFTIRLPSNDADRDDRSAKIAEPGAGGA